MAKNLSSMSLDQAVHRNMLIRILKDIYSNSSIGPIVGFKGGTAAYFFYDLSRFSVDLDFDLLDLEKSEVVFEQILKILSAYGTIKTADRKRYSLFFLLSYADKVPAAHNIKVEINMRDFGSHYELKTYLGISMKVMVREDMLAHKLVAMSERLGKTNRDIFDVWFFLHNNWPINGEIVKARTGKDLNDFIAATIASLEKLPDRGILTGIGELLNEKQKAWAKEKLLQETIFLLKLRRDNEK